MTARRQRPGHGGRDRSARSAPGGRSRAVTGKRRGEPGTDEGARETAEARAARMVASGKPMPYRVTRWGKFPALEPLFADERIYLIAKGGRPVQIDQIVLAEPTRGDRRLVG